jgi:hypothetical protein
VKIKLQRRKGEIFILENFWQSTFSGTVFEGLGNKKRSGIGLSLRRERNDAVIKKNFDEVAVRKEDSSNRPVESFGIQSAITPVVAIRLNAQKVRSQRTERSSLGPSMRHPAAGTSKTSSRSLILKVAMWTPRRVIEISFGFG